MARIARGHVAPGTALYAVEHGFEPVLFLPRPPLHRLRPIPSSGKVLEDDVLALGELSLHHRRRMAAVDWRLVAPPVVAGDGPAVDLQLGDFPSSVCKNQVGLHAERASSK